MREEVVRRKWGARGMLGKGGGGGGKDELEMGRRIKRLKGNDGRG